MGGMLRGGMVAAGIIEDEILWTGIFADEIGGGICEGIPATGIRCDDGGRTDAIVPDGRTAGIDPEACEGAGMLGADIGPLGIVVGSAPVDGCVRTPDTDSTHFAMTRR